jgi:hypothetical protein
MDEEQRQFNEKLAMEQRQNSLLNEFRQRDYELNMRQEQRQSTYQNALMKNMTEDNARANAQLNATQNKAPKYVTKEITEGDVVKTYQIPEGGQITPDTKPIAVAPRYKPTSPSSQKDFVEPGLVGDIEGTFATLKGLGGDANDQAKAPLKANLIAKTESLMESAGPTSDVGHIWDVVQKGGDVEKAINISQLARKKSYTQKQREYLRLYFKTRFIPQEKK